MSAILDALKRQEEERRRTQAATESAAERLLAQQPRAQKSGVGTGLAVSLGVLMIGGLTFALRTPTEGPSPIVAPSKAPVEESKEVPAPPPAAAPEPLARVVASWRVSAHIYGELQEDRALWINGQPYGEGDEIDGLMLEAITAEGYRVRRGEERLTRRVTPP